MAYTDISPAAVMVHLQAHHSTERTIQDTSSHNCGAWPRLAGSLVLVHFDQFYHVTFDMVNIKMVYFQHALIDTLLATSFIT